MKRVSLLVLALIIILIGAFSGCSKNNVRVINLSARDTTNLVAYHNKHKDLEAVVSRIDPNQWFGLKFGLLANEKVIINTRTASRGFMAHYIINNYPGSRDLYELLCYADDDIPAFPAQQGSPQKVGFAKRGYYQEICNQKAESVMRFIKESL